MLNRLTEEAGTYALLDYLLHLFYLIDTEFEALNLPRLRQRAPEPALAPPAHPPGPLIGNYWTRDPGRLGDPARAGIGLLLAPFKKATSDPATGRSSALNRLRRRVETVIGELAARFDAERTRARDLWHPCSRLTRKALSHTAAVPINRMAGNPPPQLDRLAEG